MKKTVYITGSGGYLGQELIKRLINNKRYNLFLCFDDATSFIANRQLQESDIIIHLVAKHPSYKGSNQEMDRINYQFTKFLFDNKKEHCQFVFLSTDYVFAGGNEVYHTGDSKNPNTFYGITKSKSEDYILKKNKNACVIRTSMLYGSNNTRRDNFINYLIKNLKNKNKVELYSDVYCRPTNVLDLIDFLEYIMEKQKDGIFHACGKEYLSRYDIGKKICIAKDYDSSLLIPCPKPKDNQMQSVNMFPSQEFIKYDNRSLK